MPIKLGARTGEVLLPSVEIPGPPTYCHGDWSSLPLGNEQITTVLTGVHCLLIPPVQQCPIPEGALCPSPIPSPRVTLCGASEVVPTQAPQPVFTHK